MMRFYYCIKEVSSHPYDCMGLQYIFGAKCHNYKYITMTLYLNISITKYSDNFAVFVFLNLDIWNNTHRLTESRAIIWNSLLMDLIKVISNI